MVVAVDVRSALRPLNLPSLVLGVWPRKPEDGRLLRLVANAFSCLVLLLSAALLYAVSLKGWTRGLFYTQVVSVALYVDFTCVTAAVCATTHLLRGDAVVAAVLGAVDQVDALLASRPCSGAIRRRLYLAVAGVVLWYGASVCVHLNDAHLDLHSLLTVLDLTINATGMQFVVLCLVIGRRFRLVNEKLAAVFSASPEKAADRDVTFFLDAGEHRPSGQEDVDKAVNDLQKVHFTLVQLASRVNRFYGPPNLCMIVLLLFSVIYAIFDLLAITVKQQMDMVASAWMMYTTLLLMSSLKILALTVSCQRTESAAVFTLTLAADLRLKCLAEERGSAKALKALIRQVDNTRLKFDACSILYIDGPLLRTVVATIVSYTIILMQFSVAEKQQLRNRGCNNQTTQ